MISTTFILANCGCSLPVLFQLTKSKTKKHFSKAYFILVIKTKTTIVWS